MTSTLSGIRRRAVASLSALGMIFTGAAVALPAAAETGEGPDPATTVSVQGADAESGLTVRIEGKNYLNLLNADGNPAAGVYVGLHESTVTFEDINADNSSALLGSDFIRDSEIVDGVLDTTLTVDAADLTGDADYEVVVWGAHGGITDASLVYSGPVPLTAAHREALFASGDGGDGDGGGDAGEGGDGKGDDASGEEPETGGETEEPAWQPRLDVYQADGVTPVGDAPVYVGDELIVKGSGLDPYANVPAGSGRPPLGSLPQGLYAVFGHFAPQWQPSTGAPSADRSVASQTWVLAADTLEQVSDEYRDSIEKQWTELHTNGSFTWTLTVPEADPSVESGRYGIFTYPAGGATNADQELEVVLNYQGERTPATDDGDDSTDEGPRDAPSTTVTVTSVDGDDGLGLRVEGTNYVDLPKASTGRDAAGVYVAVRDKSVTFDEINADTDLIAAISFIPTQAMPGGAFTANLTIAPGDLEADASYEIFVWVAHGDITPATLVFTKDLALSAEQRQTLFGDSAGGDHSSGDGSDDGNARDEEHPGEGTGDAGSGEARGSAKFATVSLAGDRTQTVTAQGFTPGETVTAALHSKVFNLGTTKADSSGRVALTFTVPSSVEAGAHKVVLTGLDSGVVVEVPFRVTGTADAAPQIVCVDEKVPAKAGVPSLNWGVKSSFTSYIQGGIAKGTISTSNGASRAGGSFYWGSGSGSFNDAGTGTLRFPGTVSFSGHGGVLSLTLSNLQVQSTGGRSGVLVGHVRSQDMNGNSVANGTVTIANLSFRSLSANGGTASATLTSAGARAFAGFYNAGDALDTLNISITGAQGERTVEVCYDAEGNRVNADGTPYTGGGLAATGAGDSAGLLALMGALTLAGAGLLFSRRGAAGQR